MGWPADSFSQDFFLALAQSTQGSNSALHFPALWPGAISFTSLSLSFSCGRLNPNPDVIVAKK